MKLMSSRPILTIGLFAALAVLAPSAIAADGNGPESSRASVQAGIDNQRQAQAVTTPTVNRPRSSAVPTLRGASADQNRQGVPTPQELNVPGNPAFGRVASS
jgi:hypothetical protein